MSLRDVHREHFIRHRPTLYHVSLAVGIESVQRHGLLSASGLMDLFEVPLQQREVYETRPRPERILLNHPIHGSAYLNDQSVLNSDGLAECLVRMTPVEWCKTLNARVFFWPAKELKGGLWGAKLGKTYQRIVLKADTRKFLEEYEPELEAAPINVGYTMRKPSKRGPHTFRPLREMFDDKSFSVTQIKELSLPHKMTRIDLLKVHEVQNN